MRLNAIKHFFLFMLCMLIVSAGYAQPPKQYKVLVVMSYEITFAWEQQIREGIETILGESCDIKYVYMNTKTDPDGAAQAAREAYDLYTRWQPDGVIAADDYAQSAFVVPYLRDKVKTPVVFCGVNNKASNYGYPASNVTGITERLNMKETIAFAKQLIPSFEKIAFMAKKSVSADLMFEQFQEEENEYMATPVAYEQPETLAQAVSVAQQLRDRADVLFIGTVSGLLDENGKPVEEKDSIPRISAAFGKPTVVDTIDRLYYGALCAVVQLGQEQGATAAEMLLRAMHGTPVPEIPITRNYYGKRAINVATAKKLGITLKPMLLRGVELIRNTE